MTKRLYETDGSLLSFTARVVSCTPAGEGFDLVLDQTAFFPEGGGQGSDRGMICGIPVLDVRRRGDDVIHRVGVSFPVGIPVECEVEPTVRIPRMQCHCAEHIVSGLIHRLYGFDNVGFHLGDDDVTLDVGGELSREQIELVETLANQAVFENVPVTVSFPTPEQLAAISYRSKLDLTEGVRIVTVEGYDVCACCAPHVARTGEIGLIRLVSFARYKGGVRIHLLAGERALADYRARCDEAAKISGMLSVPQDQIADGVARLIASGDRLAENYAALRRRYAALLGETLAPTEGNRAIYLPEGDSDTARHLAKLVTPKTGGIVALCWDAGEGVLRYLFASDKVDLRTVLPAINAALNGRGGGKEGMAEGSFKTDFQSVERFFADFSL